MSQLEDFDFDTEGNRSIRAHNNLNLSNDYA